VIVCASVRLFVCSSIDSRVERSAHFHVFIGLLLFAAELSCNETFDETNGERRAAFIRLVFHLTRHDQSASKPSTHDNERRVDVQGLCCSSGNANGARSFRMRRISLLRCPMTDENICC
jgi:hypothetical protein